VCSLRLHETSERGYHHPGVDLRCHVVLMHSSLAWLGRRRSLWRSEGERRETDEEVNVTGGSGAGGFNRGDWGALALCMKMRYQRRIARLGTKENV
jgi:hypothetical protein